MPFTSSTHFIEESSGCVTIRFRDRDDQPVTPNGANWTLTDEDGAVINSRENILISSPATQEEILLQGDDLAISSGFKKSGFLLFKRVMIRTLEMGCR
jgi:hypothetical protein